jgi:hypothetical protein
VNAHIYPSQSSSQSSDPSVTHDTEEDRLPLLLGREPKALEVDRHQPRRARALLRQHQTVRLGTARLITRL